MNRANGFLRHTGGPPLIVAHRGLSSRAPENTLASIRAALDVHAPMVEIDVHLTADDEVVAIHDRTLQRTTTGNGAVRSYALKELAAFDAGSWFDPCFAEERVPGLRDILALIGTSADLNIEVKSYPFHRVDPRHLAERTLDCVRHAGALGRVLFTSFDETVLSEVRRQERDAPIGLLNSRLRNVFRDPIETATTLGAAVFVCARQEFRKATLAQAHDRGMAMFVYTVNDPSDALRLADAGVDGIITDVADRMLSGLR